MNIDNQLLLLVDEKDTFSGKYATRKECHTGKGLHHRAFVVLLENKKGKVLLQKRKHALWDTYWDTTAISHTLHVDDHDETYDEAAYRALAAEMGISQVQLTKVGGFNYYAKHGDNCENEYCAILLSMFEGEVYPNEALVYEYKWLDKKLFIASCLKEDPRYTPWAILTGQFLAKI